MTRRTPSGGLHVRARPDADAPPSWSLPGEVDVEVVEEAAYGWARIRVTSADGTVHEGWVDGRKLVVSPTAAAPPPPPTAETTPSNAPTAVQPAVVADAAPPSMQKRRSRRWVPALVVVLALVAIGGGVALLLTRDGGDGAITTSGDSDTSTPPDADDPDPQATTPPDEPQPDPTVSGDGGEQGDPTEQTDEPVVDGVTFSEEMLASAIAAGEAAPLDGLPTRDAVATEVLAGELAAAGADLTGLKVTVYPESTAPSFVLLETDDSTALLTQDDGGESFVVAVLDSPVLATAGTQQLVLRHSSTDDEGPYVLTFMVPLADLRVAAETGSDVNESVQVQVERP